MIYLYKYIICMIVYHKYLLFIGIMLKKNSGYHSYPTISQSEKLRINQHLIIKCV